MTLEDVAARLAELLRPGGRFYNALEGTDTPTELVPGHVWQVYVWPKASAGAACCVPTGSAMPNRSSRPCGGMRSARSCGFRAGAFRRFLGFATLGLIRARGSRTF